VAMPYGLPKMDDCSINKILDWINRGALNNWNYFMRYCFSLLLALFISVHGIGQSIWRRPDSLIF
jgi:hypothetical protein